jgi:hypothetical protein
MIPSSVQVEEMVESDPLSSKLADICAQTQPEDNHAALVESIQQALSREPFLLSLSRGGWFRNGGVITATGECIGQKLDHWLETEALDVSQLWERYQNAGYKITRQNGVTHYFTASTGSEPSDFIQLEVEEIVEVIDRNLLEPGHQPDTLEDILEPEDYPRLYPTEVFKHYYRFRRLTPIHAFIDRMAEDSEYELSIQRWFSDWKHSSAGEKTPFCRQWVLGLREYIDGYGEPRWEAKPISTFGGEIHELDPDDTMRGSKLANAIHSFDRQLDYPMAWYFFMLSRKKVSPRIAEAIHNDMQGTYAYLSPRDLKVLNDWMAAPYNV